jgi:hypothetical protein
MIDWAEPPAKRAPIDSVHDEFWDVVPIPYFPDDLPRLEPDPFGWTPAELQSAVAHAHKALFPKDHHQCISLPATSSFSTSASSLRL